jgi:uncharacterized coiled-coil protein SlyX
MAKSSINFAKAKAHSSDHNFRKDEPSYLLPKQYRLENEFWVLPRSEKEIFDESAALQKTGRKPKLENSRWEAIINFNKNHSLGDLQKVAAHIEKKFNITCTSIAMHKDEGHINERGVPIYNLHAHVNFVTHKDGKQNWRKEFVKPKDLRELQTEVAQILVMERGKEGSKAQRLDHRQYKKMAKYKEGVKTVVKRDFIEPFNQQKAKIKDLKSEVKDLREKLKEQGAGREQYAKLEQLNKELHGRIKAKDLTIDELKSELNYLYEKFNAVDLKHENEALKALIQELPTQTLQEAYLSLKSEFREYLDISKIKKPKNANIDLSVDDLEEQEHYQENGWDLGI